MAAMATATAPAPPPPPSKRKRTVHVEAARPPSCLYGVAQQVIGISRPLERKSPTVDFRTESGILRPESTTCGMRLLRKTRSFTSVPYLLYNTSSRFPSFFSVTLFHLCWSPLPRLVCVDVYMGAVGNNLVRAKMPHPTRATARNSSSSLCVLAWVGSFLDQRSAQQVQCALM